MRRPRSPTAGSSRPWSASTGPARGRGSTGSSRPGRRSRPEVAAADLAIERRSIDPLRGLVADERWEELERRFDRAVSLLDFDPDDLDAARRYMDAYVSFFKYAEGHDHAHDDHAHHAHAH